MQVVEELKVGTYFETPNKKVEFEKTFVRITSGQFLVNFWFEKTNQEHVDKLNKMLELFEIPVFYVIETKEDMLNRISVLEYEIEKLEKLIEIEKNKLEGK